MADGPDRTAAIASWFQSLFQGEGVPVLVGGAAVELFTGGAYRTGDLDFVGSVSEAVARLLEGQGFQRAGRHWVHEEGQIFIELPRSALGPDERAANLIRGDVTVRIVGPEELVVDRLAAWQFWSSEQDAVNAFLIWRSNELDEDRLRLLAAARDVTVSLESLMRLRESLAGCEPQPDQLEEWAAGRP